MIVKRTLIFAVFLCLVFLYACHKETPQVDPEVEKWFTLYDELSHELTSAKNELQSTHYRPILPSGHSIAVDDTYDRAYLQDQYDTLYPVETPNFNLYDTGGDYMSMLKSDGHQTKLKLNEDYKHESTNRGKLHIRTFHLGFIDDTTLFFYYIYANFRLLSIIGYDTNDQVYIQTISIDTTHDTYHLLFYEFINQKHYRQLEMNSNALKRYTHDDFETHMRTSVHHYVSNDMYHLEYELFNRQENYRLYISEDENTSILQSFYLYDINVPIFSYQFMSDYQDILNYFILYIEGWNHIKILTDPPYLKTFYMNDLILFEESVQINIYSSVFQLSKTWDRDDRDGDIFKINDYLYFSIDTFTLDDIHELLNQFHLDLENWKIFDLIHPKSLSFYEDVINQIRNEIDSDLYDTFFDLLTS